MIGREDDVKGLRDRILYVQWVLGMMFLALFARVFYLQVFKGEELKRYSEQNRLKKDRRPPSRGIIFDRHGKTLVDNRASFDVVLFSQYYPFDHKTDERLAKALQMPVEELRRKMEKNKKYRSFYPTLLKADVDKDIIANIETDAQGFPGIDIEANVQRRYPLEDVSAQLFGYIGEVNPTDIAMKNFEPGETIGKMGIERTYDAYLRGVNGVGYVEVDALGRRRKTEGSERVMGFVTQAEPIAGNNLYLTLDSDLEQAAAKGMKERKYHGSVVALDVRTGEVLAMVNTPSYHPGKISGREVSGKVWAALRSDRDKPLRNRAIQDHYPPGSTFKLFLAIAGLAEGTSAVKHSINCTGKFHFGNRDFHCWKKHGVVDLMRSIKESCDSFYYNLGNQLGVDKIAHYAREFGFGTPTGIRLAGEQGGNIPDSEWKKRVFKDIWHPGETLSVAIGQGFVDVTPLQLATAYAALGNGGEVFRPYLVRRVEGLSGEVIRDFEPELVRKIELPAGVLDTVKEGLAKVVNEPGGTAYSGRSQLTIISGKTGTSQVRTFSNIKSVKCENLSYYERDHGWFVGFAPKENPEIVVATITEHTCHSAAAVPVVKEVIDAYFTKKEQLNRLSSHIDSLPNREKASAEPALPIDEAEPDEEIQE